MRHTQDDAGVVYVVTVVRSGASVGENVPSEVK